MRKSPAAAFTLIEMLTVLAIIVILTGMVISVGGYVQRKGALSRATGEIAMLVSACESYKSDNGSFPRDIPTTGTSTTDTINPKADFFPTDAKYAASSLFLYKELSGDKTGKSNAPDGVPDEGEPRYMKDVEQRILKATRDPVTKVISSVQYMQDPFGFPYAYSTSAANIEDNWRKQLLQNPALRATLKRPTGNQVKGYNSGSYDLWSTGGDTKGKGSDVWIKNW